MNRRPALLVKPPPVPAGRRRCPCCDGPPGPPAWEIPVCVVCWDAEQGRRVDPTVYQMRGTRGSFTVVKFARKHTQCPFGTAEPGLQEPGPGGPPRFP